MSFIKYSIKEEFQMNTKNELSAKQALEMAQKAVDAGNKKKAEKYYTAVLNKYPENQDAIDGIKSLHPNTLFRSDLDELEKALEEKKFREVEVRANMLLELYPEVFELYHYLAIALSSQNKHLEALPLFKKAVVLNPHDKDAQFNLGNALFMQRDFKTAIRCYKKVTDLSPEFGEAHFQAGNAFFELKDYKNATEAYEIALKFFPKSINVISNFADCYYSMGHYKEALDLLDKALPLTEKTAKLHNKIGDINLMSGQFDNAIKAYTVASEIDPNIIEFQLKIADVEKTKGDYVAAQKMYSAILEKNENNPICISNLAVLNHLLGNDDLSSQYIEKLDDQSIGALNNPAQRQFCKSYKRFMKKLHSFNQSTKVGADEKLNNIWAFGGDTAVSLKGHQISLNGEKFVCDAKWTANDRALLIARSGDNLFKQSLKHQLSTLEAETNVLFAFGSNDFLPTTNFLQDAKNNKDKISKSVSGLVRGYFNYSLLMAREYNLNPIYVALPAPVVESTVEGAKEVSELIKQFNADLKKLCDEEKITFIDLFAFTDNGDGCADQSKYLEGIHILPTAIGDALAQ